MISTGTNLQEKQRLLQQVDYYYKNSMSKWDYLPIELLVSDFSIRDVLIAILKLGVSLEQVEKKILTLPISAKITQGKIIGEQELNVLRGHINNNNLKLLTKEIAANSRMSQKEILDEIEGIYYLMPMLVQRESFLKKIANGVHSNQKLLKILKNVEEDSYYRPLAVKLLDNIETMSKKERQRHLNSIRTAAIKNKRACNRCK